VLKCHIRSDYHHPKVRPFFYFDKAGKNFTNQLPYFRSLPKASDKLYFRGNPHLGRQEVLNQLKDLLNENQEPIGQYDFYKELAQHKLALSLRGMAKANHREFEAFAVGTPVIMQENPNRFYKPLVPNFHYVSVEPNEQGLAACIRERLEQMDNEFLQFIANNAMEYYDKYIRFDNSVLWMQKLLEL
jgi:hypothetical protein